MQCDPYSQLFLCLIPRVWPPYLPFGFYQNRSLLKSDYTGPHTVKISFHFDTVTDLLFFGIFHRCLRNSQGSDLSISWPRSFTCSSVAQTLAGAAYLPTSFFASEGDPFGHPYLLQGFGSHLIAVSSPSGPLGLGPCFLPGPQSPLFTFSVSSLQPPIGLTRQHHFFFNLFPFACSFALRKLWAPCHLGQPPLFSILYLPPAAKGSLPFRSVPLVASFILHCCLLDFSTLALGSLPFRSVSTASR